MNQGWAPFSVHGQYMTVAESVAEGPKTFVNLSYRVVTNHQSLSRPNAISIP